MPLDVRTEAPREVVSEARARAAAGLAERVREAVSSAVLGKDRAVLLLFAALVADQHAIIEDVPGVGKTSLAKALARATGCSFSRIQFTPDLLPGDVTGSLVHEPGRGFRFAPGPLFAQIVLADEINRASPKTQSALLEAMEERQVTVDRETHRLPEPFLVLATKNPLEHEGTFPLPEAQVDRFGVRVTLGYPDGATELRLISGALRRDQAALVEEVMPAAEVSALQEDARRVYLHPDVAGYILALVQASRRHPAVEVGASPRAALALRDLARAAALLAGRTFVRPDDVQEAAQPVLAHRLVLRPEAAARGEEPAAVVRELLERVPVPKGPVA
ncbi:MAG: MoxR family ATPase [Clostridia bacterium]|nr:MoxR family ATPase [Clostridia bacterium]